MPHKIGSIIHLERRGYMFGADQWQRLHALAPTVATESPTPLSEDEAIEILHDCTIALGSWRTPRPTPRLLEACPDLRLWVHVAGSVKPLFNDAVLARGMHIVSCAAPIADNVAEFTLAMLVTGLRHIFDHARHMRRPGSPRPPRGKMLCDSTIGVIGASLVGRRVMRLLNTIGCRILLYDPYIDEAGAAELGATLEPDLVELCANSDAVTLHAPYLPSTRHMLRAEHFRAMRDDTVFINTARGGCIDEQALIAELARGRLVACLDVTDPEPPDADSALRRLPNVILTPHIAGGAGNLRMGRLAVDAVEAFINDRPIPGRVDPADLDRIA
ncbi:MAG: phosphoglycerate dehydrogenase [Verrucomicrobia bacterium]|nr:MAG: phosphoglycerate dehydrogenase [Verrucomicrobiota bacterium]